MSLLKRYEQIMWRKYVRKILFFEFLIIMFYVVDGMPASFGSGPYVSIVKKVEKCEKWTQPIDKNPPVFLYMEMYNTSSKFNLLRGNVTVLTNCKNKKISMKCFIWEQSKWKLAYMMNNMGCNRFLPIIAAAINVKYDPENCVFFKGNYSFENLDVNKPQHLLHSVQDYGRIKCRHEFISQAGSAFCWEIETLVVPATN